MDRARLTTGIEVAYSDTGPRDAEQTLVFSHGFLMDHRMFAPQLGEFEGEHRCITWDERSHGETSDGGLPYSYWDSAADLLALLDHLEVGRAVLVGMSQGGFLSLRAALLAPDRVVGLVLIDSQAGLELPESIDPNAAMNHVWTTRGPTEDLTAVIARTLIGRSPQAATWLATWRALPATWFALPFQCLVGRDDLTARLTEISCPVLVVHGEEDRAIPMARAQELAAAVPDCRGLIRVAGAAHAANLTHPEPVNAALRDFLADL